MEGITFQWHKLPLALAYEEECEFLGARWETRW
ncbi:hypothetical protein ICNINCKA_01065 [Synechococcus sp. CBW1107]|nr:hypothetical protein ICNINCKA_01065 [Synechococcus sp. CBW1107]